MTPHPVWGGVRSLVDHADADEQSVRAQDVADLQRELERVAAVAGDPAAQQHRLALGLGDLEVEPADQAVDGGPGLRLGHRQLVLDASVGVAGPGDAPRPGHQRLALVVLGVGAGGTGTIRSSPSSVKALSIAPVRTIRAR